MTHVAYAFSQIVCWLFFRCRFGLEISGQAHVPKTGGVIVACNHVSFLDPPVLGAACPRPLRFMARADLFHGALGAYMRAVGVLPLKRGEADPSAVRAAVAILRGGGAVAIFPEGGRQLSGKLGRAKRGVGLLAQLGRVPVVPALIQGTCEALPPDATRLQRAKIRVAFAPSIPYTYTPVVARVPSAAPRTAGTVEGPLARLRHEQLADAVTHAWRQLALHVQAGAAPACTSPISNDA